MFLIVEKFQKQANPRDGNFSENAILREYFLRDAVIGKCLKRKVKAPFKTKVKRNFYFELSIKVTPKTL